MSPILPAHMPEDSQMALYSEEYQDDQLLEVKLGTKGPCLRNFDRGSLNVLC